MKNKGIKVQSFAISLYDYECPYCNEQFDYEEYDDEGTIYRTCDKCHQTFICDDNAD